MYFAVWILSNPSIEKAALDGSQRSVFVGRDIGRANGLTIDLEESYLYWTDIDFMVIEKASLLDPQKTRQIIQAARNDFKPYSLTQYQVIIVISI